MSTTQAAVIGDPFFDTSLVLAKGIAKQLGARELTPALVGGGLFLALRASGKDAPSVIVANQEELRRCFMGLNLGDDPKIEPLRDEKLPLTKELRQLVSGSGADLDTFVSALVRIAMPLTLEDNEVSRTILGHATSIAARVGQREITPEMFAAGAYYAFMNGSLIDAPAVSAQIAANAKSFQALVFERGWSQEFAASHYSENLPPSAELLSAVQEGGPEGNPVISAINAGMAAGAEILAKQRTAYHEAGHAVVSSVLRPQVSIKEVNIIDQDGAAGITRFDLSSLDFAWRREDYLVVICVSLSGAVAQQIKFGRDQIDEGAKSDIEIATRGAWNAIAVLGLDEDFGPVNLSALAEESGLRSGWLYDQAQQRLQQVIKEAHQRSHSILTTNWAQVESVAKALIEKRRLTDDELGTVLVENGLSEFPGVRRARSRPVERRVEFPMEPGVCMTAEGPARYRAGDALVFGREGESWPVSREFFNRTYEPIYPLKSGEDGWYRKIVSEVLALPLGAPKRVDLSSGRGILMGQAGDWIVDYGGGDLAVVSGPVFSEAYELVDAPEQFVGASSEAVSLI